MHGHNPAISCVVASSAYFVNCSLLLPAIRQHGRVYTVVCCYFLSGYKSWQRRDRLASNSAWWSVSLPCVFLYFGGNILRGLQMPDPKKGEFKNVSISETHFTAIISKTIHKSISGKRRLKISTKELLKNVRFGVTHKPKYVALFLFFEYSRHRTAIILEMAGRSISYRRELTIIAKGYFQKCKVRGVFTPVSSIDPNMLRFWLFFDHSQL